MIFSAWNDEVYHFLFDGYLTLACKTSDEPAIDTYKSLGGLDDLHLAGTIGTHTTMVKETASEQEPEAFEELEQFGGNDERHIDHAIIRHSIGCLSVAWSAAYADVHHLAIDEVAVYLQPHLVFHAVKDEEEG